MQEKRCCRCEIIKPIDMFTKNRRMKDGLAIHCRTCKSFFDKKYRENHLEKKTAQEKRWQEANKDWIKQRNREHRERNAERLKEQRAEYYEKNRNEILERVKTYYQENKEAVTVYAERYREENPEKLKQCQKNHYWANRERRIAEVKAYNQTPAGRATIYRRASKRRTAKGRATSAWSNKAREAAIYELRDSLIEDCRGEPFHVDHDIPLQGKRVSGLHVHNNLEVLQGAANLSKRHNFDIDEFPLGIPGYIWLALPNAVYSDIARRARVAYSARKVVRRAREAA